ncbi:tail component [Streptococcus phage P7134]|uniref:Tail component protein n=10 Tax=Moineauvirus TaxID=1623304 RepID=A0A3S7W7X9_9CAUD|nr:tail protein [Streptococcus phage CHPC1005]YP_010645095.1 tail protein [Streptococcus phage CHPC1027]YP_010645188.1 tail protein [Streptococcus phage CHPC1033]YP_010645474.1 tail protein [Streptococcus phage CHPC1067]YP_010645706.1 tail protein [Streptococcus phage CHPC595]YP_010646457.1 tail protein [Streptococcus phage D4276]YP_010646912.1 tail protein [Streptococcus phage P7133]YP_010646955.1 tail protein [Streptococcus phage P7134]YP_010647670.1 tail protein [Streptococcus phage P990
MLATVKLKELIEGKGFGEISEVYANNLPKELEDNTDKTIVLLTESNPSLDLSGNNTFFKKIDRVEVQIFYKLDIDFDIEAFEMELIKFLKSEHYSITDIREHSIDPDTLQLTAVFFVAFDRFI